MIQLSIDSDKRLWYVDEGGRMRKDTGSYLLYFGENGFEEIELSCVTNIHGNIIRQYATSLIVQSDEEQVYPVSFTLTGDRLISEPIPVDAAMTSRAGEIAVYVRVVYQDRVVGRTNHIHFKVRSGVCGDPDIPHTLQVTPREKPQEFSSPAGYDRVEVGAVQAEELTVYPEDARQVFLPAENRYFGKVTVERPDLSLEDVSVIPSTERQYITADDGHYAIRSVRVEPISSALDLQIKRAEPSVREQTITADGEYVGLSQVRIDPVTAAIDPNISPLNIRKDVEILGVRGEAEPIEITVEDEDDDPCLAYLYDYDGTPVATYTAAQLEELESLPVPPEHSGLRFLRYNRTKASMIEYLTDNHTSISAGAMYETSDGHTRITVSPDPSNLSAELVLSLDQTQVNIDWGDGNTETLTEVAAARTLTHTYAQQREYVVDIERVYGNVYLGNRTGSAPVTSQKGLLKHVEIGRGFLLADKAFSDCNTLESVIIPDSINSLAIYTFNNCYSLRFVVLPDTFVSLASYVFNNCYSLREVVFSDPMSGVSTYAFRYCSGLERFCCSRVLGSIGRNAFEGCYNLKKIYLGEEMTSIAESTFSECRNLVTAKLPATVTAVYRNAFYNCASLKWVDLPEGLLSIGERAFYAAGLRSLRLPSTLTTVDTYVFSDCKALEEVTLPSSLTGLAPGTFANCYGLKRVNTGSVSTIGSSAFTSCKALTQLTLGENTTSLGYSALANCIALNRLYLPPSVSFLDASFVSGCSSLKELDLSRHIAPPQATNSTFSNIPAFMRVYVRDEEKRALFASANGWSSISSRIMVKPTP